MTQQEYAFSENVVYVGVDGSDSALNAALWAAGQAQRRSAALCLLHGYSLSVASFAGEAVYPSDLFDAGQDWEQQMLRRTRSAVLAGYPNLEVTTLLRIGSAADLLKEVSARALLTVVGSHGTHPVLDSLLGSVASGLVTRGSGPIAVIHSAGGTANDSGPIVVGLDGLSDSDDALAFAFLEASLRGQDLIAVHSWDDQAVQGFALAAPVAADGAFLAQEEIRLLAEQLAGWSDKYPDVAVQSVVLRGTPQASLLDFCRRQVTGGGPAMLVVGSRGRGKIAGLLLGSTSQAMIAAALCPVVVVRGRPDPDGA